MEPRIGMVSLRAHGMKLNLILNSLSVMYLQGSFIFSIKHPECLGALLWRVNKTLPGLYQVLI